MYYQDNGFVWTYTIVDKTEQFRFESDGKTVAGSQLADGVLSLSVLFSWNAAPLVLKAKAEPGQEAMLIFRRYRMELYVDSVLCDEEWPYGEPCFKNAELTAANTQIHVSDIPAEAEMPFVCGSFINAEGWNPGGDVFVGDCMPYVFEDRFHVLYLKDRHHHCSKWVKGAHQWEHISSDDLVHWKVHPMAVQIDRQEEASICTGSWIYLNGKHYLYYTVRQMDGSPAPIRRSVSEDGYHFSKDNYFSFTLSERYKAASARDPKVIRSSDNKLHMILTTTDLSIGKGCLVHLISDDGSTFTEAGNLYESPDTHEPECPDYFTYNGKYYLIFSLCTQARYLVSDKPFSDFIEPDTALIPCAAVPKCAVWKNRIIFVGYRGNNGGYAGVMTFKEARQETDGTFSFVDVCEMKN